MKRIFLFLLISGYLLCTNTNAQSYSKYMQQGKDFYNNTDYLTALERFDLAYEFAKTDAEKADSKTWKNKSREKIRLQQVEIKKALIEEEKQRHLAQEANLKAQKIIDAFYFYDNKFALAFNGSRYGFIDKDGNVKIPYYYEDAVFFNTQTGLARVIREDINYLLDTTGTEYLLTLDLNNLTTSTQALDFSKQAKTEIPRDIFNFPQINVLILNTNNLTALTPDIGRITSLNFLDIRWNQLISLPVEIGNLRNLEKFLINGNKLKTIPSELGNLVNLKELDLAINQLIEIPDNIKNLKKLSILDIGQNRLTNFPIQILELSALKIIRLNQNQINEIPLNISKLKNITTLDLSWNKISKIPSSICQLTELQFLSLEKNQINELPPEIGELKNLTQLRLDYNRLIVIPPEIGDLNNLSVLRLKENPITSLPSEIGRLKNLRLLDIRGTKISEFEKQKIKNLLPSCEIVL